MITSSENCLPFSKDYLLGKRLSLYQPLEGHRFGTDAVWLAAALSPKNKESVLEVGCGVGAALFCLGNRATSAFLTGLEREASLVEFANKNAMENSYQKRSSFVIGDVFDKALSLVPQSFDHVMTNPPFIEAGQTLSSSPLKARAYHTDQNKTLKEWLRACLKYAKPRGTLTIIHRADHLDQLLQGLKGRVGDLKILPIASKEGRIAKRVLITGRKGVSNPCTLFPPLLVHQEDGTYTDEALRILREGKSISWTK